MSVVDVERSAHDVITRVHVYEVTGGGRVGEREEGVGMGLGGKEERQAK